MAPTQTVACESAKDDPAHCWTEFRPVCVCDRIRYCRDCYSSPDIEGGYFSSSSSSYIPPFSEADRRQRQTCFLTIGRRAQWPEKTVDTITVGTQTACAERNKKSIETL